MRRRLQSKDEIIGSLNHSIDTKTRQLHVLIKERDRLRLEAEKASKKVLVHTKRPTNLPKSSPLASPVYLLPPSWCLRTWAGAHSRLWRGGMTGWTIRLKAARAYTHSSSYTAGRASRTRMRTMQLQSHVNVTLVAPTSLGWCWEAPFSGALDGSARRPTTNALPSARASISSRGNRSCPVLHERWV